MLALAAVVVVVVIGLGGGLGPPSSSVAALTSWQAHLSPFSGSSCATRMPEETSLRARRGWIDPIAEASAAAAGAGESCDCE